VSARHRRQQPRHRLVEVHFLSPERIDPPHFRHQDSDAAERQGDTDKQHDDNQPVQKRIAHERGKQLPVEDKRHEAGNDQKDHHPQQEDAGAR
jgi:hypothetical protein